MAHILNLIVNKVTVLSHSNRTDIVVLRIEGPSPYPEMQAAEPDQDYGPALTITVRKGYAKEWLAAMGIPDDLIEVVNCS